MGPDPKYGGTIGLVSAFHKGIRLTRSLKGFSVGLSLRAGIDMALPVPRIAALFKLG
jgi:hypothetical protein